MSVSIRPFGHTREGLALSAYTIENDGWRIQTASNRQGSDGFLPPERGSAFSEEERAFHEAARALYQKRIDAGIAREQARKDLPLSTYTEAYWKCDLHNLFHFLSLRMESHAQWEIVQYATTIGEKIIRVLFPVSYEAFLDYNLNSLHLTALDQGVIQRLAGRTPATEEDFLQVQDPRWQGLERCRERDECRQKLRTLGILK